MNTALVLTAFFNAAWQGTLLCAVALAAFRIFRRLNATTMFAVWSVLLGIAVLLPVANYTFAAKPYTVKVTAAPVVPVQANRPRAAVLSEARAGALDDTPIRHSQKAPPTPPSPTMIERATALGTFASSHAGLVLIVLALIAALRVGMLLRDLVRMFLARAAVRLIDAPVHVPGRIRRRYEFAASHDMRSPCVIGFSPALIVIPEELLGEPAEKLASIVLHEREHVRRFDDVQNVLQRLIGAVAFFLPGVAIALRELALYREQICDDAAINGMGDAVSYALTLSGMAQWAVGRGTPVPTFIFKRRQLLHRLEVLLDSAVSHSQRTNRRFAVTAGAVLALAALIVLRFQIPVVAQTIVVPAIVPLHAAARAHVAIAPLVRPAQPAHPAAAAAPKKPAKKAHAIAAVAKPAKALKHAKRVQKLHTEHWFEYSYSNTAPLARPALAPAVSAEAMVASSTGTAAAAIAPMAKAASMTAKIAAPIGWSKEDLLDALQAANMRDIPVDKLIAMRDHGVSGSLVRAATAYFGRISPDDLTYLADHGVGQRYIEVLRSSGINGISPASAVLMMDHGVGANLIAAAYAFYNPHPSASDLTYLADHGMSGTFLQSLRQNGLNNISVADTVRLLDHGVDGVFISRVRHLNPRASIDDIIRLHDSGF